MCLSDACVCVYVCVWRCKQLSSDPIPSNVTTTNFHAPRANISHASPSYNSNQAMGAAIAYRSAEGKGIGNKQDNVVWEPLTFDWFLIGSDRRLTWNEIHTGHPEHTTVEKTNKQIGSEISALGLHCKIKITTMVDFFSYFDEVNFICMHENQSDTELMLCLKCINASCTNWVQPHTPSMEKLQPFVICHEYY